MNNKNLRMAEELVKAAEDLIFADSDYIYDPEHKKHPSGGYHKTEKGWSKLEEKKEKSPSSSNVEMTDEQKKLDKLSKSDTYTKRNLSKNRNCHPKTLEKLSRDEDEEVRRGVASNPNTPKKILKKLSNDSHPFVVCGYCENPTTPPEDLEKFSHHQEIAVRWGVASNPNTPTNVLNNLSLDKNPDVRGNVALNSNSSIETLEKLSKDGSKNVRGNVAHNPNANTQILNELSKDEYWYSRRGVAEHQNTSIETLEKLSKDQDEYVVKSAKSNIIKRKFNKDYFKNTPPYDNDFENMVWSDNAPDDFYENVLKYGQEGHKWEIANSYKTPSHVLDKLATDKNDYVRFKAIQNDNTSTETLTKVYDAEYKKNKNNSDFFEEIGKHKNTSPEILSRLRSNPSKEVRRSVAGNSNTLPEDLDVLAHYNNDRIILMNVAGNENANEDTLTYLFNSYHNKDVRGELAANDSCPEDIVKILAKSKDSYVRAGALGNLKRRKNKKEEQKFDISKLSPEMREKVKDWDIEDIKKFLGWLKENN